jgi:gluconate 5-dehydrogenase
MSNSQVEEKTVQQLFDLTGTVSLVTGACGHLGKAIAQGLAEAGSSIVVSSREEGRAVQFSQQLPRPMRQTHLGIQLDQLDDTSRQTAVQRVQAELGGIDTLVNNGHFPLSTDLNSVTEEEFRVQLSNASAYFFLAKSVYDLAVAQQRQASIIMLGSMYGSVGSYPDTYEGVSPASPVAYHTLKGGILQMTRHLAVYWAVKGVRVNSLSPGPFPAPSAPREMVQRLEQRSPMKRMGKPDELKGAVVFLASRASSYMTGQNLIIDGGWTAW